MPQEAAPQGRSYLILGALCFVVAGILLGGYLFVPSFARTLDGLYVAARMPQDLKGVYLYKSGDVYAAYRLGTFGLERAADNDYFMPAGSVSPDGTRVVYAYGSTTQDVMPFVSGRPIRPSEWTIVTRPSDGTELTFVAKGYAPAFIDNDHIAFLSDGGLVMFNTRTSERSLVFAFPEPMRIDSFVRYSPDRTMVMWTKAGTGDTTLGEISPGAFTLIRSFTASTPSHLLLTNENLYSFRLVDGKVQIIRQVLGEGSARSVIVIPASLSIRSIML